MLDSFLLIKSASPDCLGQNLRSSRCRPVFVGRTVDSFCLVGISAGGTSLLQSHRGSLIARTMTATARSDTVIEWIGADLLCMRSKNTGECSYNESRYRPFLIKISNNLSINNRVTIDAAFRN